MSDSHCRQLRALDGHISQFYEDFVTGFPWKNAQREAAAIRGDTSGD